MHQMETARWLKGITIILGIMGLLFFFLIMPLLAEEMVKNYPEVSFLYWSGLIYGWFIALFCYAVLFQFWKVCVQIGRDNSFSRENANAFAVISRLALILAGVWFMGMLALALRRWLNPGIGIFLILAVLISIIIAILAAALSHLIQKAYELKLENELTI